MPHPLLIFSQSEYLIQVVIQIDMLILTNSVDPDQLVSSDSVQILHCLQRQGISGFSRTRVKYSLDAPWVEASNEYPKPMISLR